MGDHPLTEILHNAALGRFPPPDGLVEVFPPPPSPADAIIAFNGHHVIAADVDPAWVRGRLRPGDLSAPLGARFLSEMAERLRTAPGLVDAVFAGTGRGREPALHLAPGPALRGHERVERSLLYRTDVEVLETEDGSGVLVLGRGLAGRREAAFEVEPEARGRGLGRALVEAALDLTPKGEPLFMQAAPGNAPSLRAIIAGGLKPIGAEVLFLKQSRPA